MQERYKIIGLLFSSSEPHKNFASLSRLNHRREHVGHIDGPEFGNPDYQNSASNELGRSRCQYAQRTFDRLNGSFPDPSQWILGKTMSQFGARGRTEIAIHSP